ncbi:hypothetical protein EJB05_01468, partial [Eragrostis curvula]
MAAQETQVGDLPEACLAYAISLTSPSDACRCAVVSPFFRAAADSDHVWQRFIPKDLEAVLQSLPLAKTARKKDAYIGLCDDVFPVDGDSRCRVWLEKASGAKCYALSARRLSLPWDDGEFSWRWTPHPLSRFAEVAELVDCTSLESNGQLRAAALTPSTAYAAYLVYGTAEGHRGLSYPDQETTVRWPWAAACWSAIACASAPTTPRRKSSEVPAGLIAGRSVVPDEPRRPRRRCDGWWEMEMGRLRKTNTSGEKEDVVASFEVLGWYLKRGLVIEGIEFRPVHN